MVKVAYSVLRLLILTAGLFMFTGTHGMVPGSAKTDPRFALGYLVVTYYPGVDSTGINDSRAGIQEAINDAYKLNMALLFPQGTYLVSDVLKCYKWQYWDTSSGRDKPVIPPRINHTLIGSEKGDSRPVIKLMANAPGFDDPLHPRPVLVFRNFIALNRDGVPPLTDPDDPLFGVPENFAEKNANLFEESLRGIDFDLGGNPGAVGVSMRSAQRSSIINVRINAEGAYCGFYGIPGRNMGAANIEVTGGQYGVFHRAAAGSVIVGGKFVHQTKSAVYNEDFVALTVVGFHIVSENSPALFTAPDDFSGAVGNLALVDGIIEMHSGGLAIDNSNGKNIYLDNVYFKGADSILQSGKQEALKGFEKWIHVKEYAYTDQREPADDPVYEKGDQFFHTYSVVQGVISKIPEPLFAWDTAAPGRDFVAAHLWENLPLYEGQDDGTAVVTDPKYGAIPDDDQDDWAAITQAISESENGCVYIPKGEYYLSKPLVLGPESKVFGMGRGVSTLITDGRWAGGPEAFMLETQDDLEAETYLGFLTLEYAPADQESFNAGCISWKAGRRSLICAVEEVKAWGTHESPLPRIMIRYSRSAGGKMYFFSPYGDGGRNVESRIVQIRDTREPLYFYGLNLEATKGTPVSLGTNLEITGAENIRVYSIKREGNSPTVIINDAQNIGLYGMGRMNIPLSSGLGGYVQIYGESNDIVMSNLILDRVQNTSNQYILQEAIHGAEQVSLRWPENISVYKRGETWDMEDSLPGKATFIFPADRADQIPLDLTLSWRPGSNARGHVLYFGKGESLDSIGSFSGDSIQIGRLENNTAYRWRIDAYNEHGIRRGNIWTFQSADTMINVNREDPVLESIRVYPNPFERNIEITYEILRPSSVQINIYRLDGRRVWTREQARCQPGTLRTSWDGSDQTGKPLEEGVYCLVLRAGDKMQMRKLLKL